MNVKVRPMEGKDVNKMMELTNEWISKDRNIRLEMFLDCQHNPNYHVILIEVDGEVVGFLSFTMFTCWIRCLVQFNIHGIYIQEKWRGKGLGKKLLSESLKSFIHDISFVSSNLDWYRKLGYNIGEDKTWFRWNK